MEAFAAYWAGRSGRERVLLMAAGALAAGVLFWLLLRPVAALMLDGQNLHRAAIEREGRVMAKAALLREKTDGSVATGISSPSQYLAQSASEMGLTLSRNEARGQVVSIAIASAKAQAVLAWIAGLERQNFVIDALSITPLADGNVGMTAELRAVQP